MFDSIFPEEVLARHRCRLDKKKLLNAPVTEWESLKTRAHHMEVLRAQIAQLDEKIEASGDPEAKWEMKRNARKLREIASTIFPAVMPYLVE